MSVSSIQAPALRLACVAMAAVLVGCANPVVKLDVAGHSPQASPAPSGEPASIADAINKLNHVRAAYNEAIRDQTGTTQNSVTGLVWLGAVMLGGASKVHRDVLVTAGVIGGTTYGLTVAQLDKRRIDVWQAGIDTLDCARAAIVPLEMTDGDRLALRGSLGTLRGRKAAVEAARSKLAAHLGEIYVTAEADEAIRALLLTTDEALKQSMQTQRGGEFLVRASRGSELSSAVNRISSKVTEVMGNIALPPTAVKDILAGLPTQINAIVPGAVSTSKAAAGDGGAKAESESKFAPDIQGMKQALSQLAVAQEAVNDLLETVDAPAAVAALKACNLAEVIKPLELVPSTEIFTQGRARVAGFEIKGGLPNYRVKVLGALPEGLSVSFEGDSANTVSITASDKVQPAEVRILVSDRNSKTQQFVVKVQAAVSPQALTALAVVPPAPAPAPAEVKDGKTKTSPATPKPTPSPTPAPLHAPPPTQSSSTAAIEAAWKDLRTALTAPGFSRTLRGVTFGVESTELKAGRLFVKLKCSKPDAGLPAIDVREELAAVVPAAKATLIKYDALDAKLDQIDVSRSKPCVKD